ncbi:MAG: DUF1573 domain-containing protein [Bacteroidetes bacterium]|nr:MAG: DUF1573 domain-containing protein [Bacteroidota bacterium]TNE99344.1 MAG: DUF1573 domain-containing protein [Bacteroidota bacterium]
MKKLLFSLLMVFAAGTVGTAVAQEVENGAKIEFEKEVHDYGTIENGANGECTFEFKNTGNAPLIISNAKGSCGCTVPSWPKEPIAPGKTGTITVKYDTKRAGAINKSVTITSNAVNAPTKVIRIKGNVKPAPTSGAPVNTSGAPTNN